MSIRGAVGSRWLNYSEFFFNIDVQSRVGISFDKLSGFLFAVNLMAGMVSFRVFPKIKPILSGCDDAWR